MDRLSSQITWGDHLTSPGLQRTTWALFIQMERADAAKGIDIVRKNHQQGPFDVQMSHEQLRILHVTHKHTQADMTRTCKLMLTIRLHASTLFFFFQYSTKTLQIFSRTCQCRGDLLPLRAPQCIKSKQQLMCFGLQDKTGHFLLIMPQKGQRRHLFSTNVARGCCY